MLDVINLTEEFRQSIETGNRIHGRFDHDLESDCQPCHDEDGSAGLHGFLLDDRIMPKLRFNIASLLVIILVTGVGFAALRESSDLWESGVFSLTIGVLLISILFAVHRKESSRAFCIGFALFGWTYFGTLPGPIDRVQADHDEGVGLPSL
jgi:hypothetical protein